MIEALETWVDGLFIATFLLCLFLFYLTNGRPKAFMLWVIAWSIGHGVLAYQGFYQDTMSVPPRFGLVLIPTTVLIIWTLLPTQRARFSARRDMRWSPFFHVVRLPVEIVLYQLFLVGMIPELMTFGGRNFDILMGITAPLVGLLNWSERLSPKLLLAWNVLGLGLILFIFINAILSAELPIQQFAFEQPNRAISYFPYILLPATIVPMVIWTHLMDIFTLMKKN